MANWTSQKQQHNGQFSGRKFELTPPAMLRNYMQGVSDGGGQWYNADGVSKPNSVHSALMCCFWGNITVDRSRQEQTFRKLTHQHIWLCTFHFSVHTCYTDTVRVGELDLHNTSRFSRISVSQQLSTTVCCSNKEFDVLQYSSQGVNDMGKVILHS